MVNKSILATLFIFLMVLLPSVSAVKIQYSPNGNQVKDMVVSVQDTILWDLIKVGEQGTLELKSHKTPTEVLKVGTGWQVTMIYESNFKNKYENALGNVTFIDMRTGQQVKKDYKFVYMGNEIRTRDTYGTRCNTSINKTYSCSSFVNGTENYVYQGWLDYNSKEIPNGKITLGLMTNVEVNDYVDGIWKVQDKKIEKHASWTADLNVGLVSYYKLDETSGDLIDSLRLNNLTASGTGLYDQTGKINRSIGFDDNGEHFKKSSATGIDFGTTTNFTINLWIKNTSAIGNDRNIFSSRNMAESQPFYRIFIENNQICYEIASGGGANRIYFASNQTTLDGNWHMVTMRRSDSGLTHQLFIDNILAGQSTGTTKNAYGNAIILGDTRADRFFGGLEDEFSIHNRSLSQAEITQLYNGGAGISYTTIFGFVPNITMNTASQNLTEVQVTTINLSVFDAIKVQNVSIYVNGVLNQTNTSGLNNTNYLFNITLADGTYTILGNAFNNQTSLNSANSSAITIIVESTHPVITGNLTNSTLYVLGGNLTLNYNVTHQPNLTGVTAWYSYNGTNRTLNTSLSSINFTTATGQYELILYANDSVGNQATPVSLNFSLDSVYPQLALNYPTSLINYGAVNGTLQLNFTATDSNLDKVWYNYNGTNVTIAGALTGVANLSNIILSTKKNVTIYANDSVGNLNTSVFSWDYILFTNQTIYNPTTVTTSSETFTLVNVKHSSIASITAKLWYGGTSYTSTVTTSGDNVNISNTFEIPSGAANRNFFWEITAVGTGGTYYINTTSLNQTVSNLSFVSCDSPGTLLTLNFTTYDSTTMLPINTSFEGTFSYFTQGGSGLTLETYNYQNFSENRSNFMFCLNSSGKNVTLNGFLNYFKTGFDARNYILSDALIGNFTQDIPLYLTATSLTDVVTFTVQDQNYDAIAGALVTVQRWNIGTNTYSTIGMFTTSSTGQGIMDLELYSTWYRASVVNNGVIVAITDVQKLSTTTWPIIVNLGVSNPFDLFRTISHGLVFNNVTNITTFSWTDTSGYVQTGCLTIKNSTNIGYITLSQQCVSSVSGTINYQLTHNSTYMVYGTIDLTSTYGNASSITDVLFIDLNGPTLLGKTISPFGKVISFIAIGTAGAIGIAAGSPILAGILVILVMFGLWKIGFLLLTEAIFWGIIIAIILVLTKQSKKGGN